MIPPPIPTRIPTPTAKVDAPIPTVIEMAIPLLPMRVPLAGVLMLQRQTAVVGAGHRRFGRES
ncbi:hypothetical protein BAUCODRAFT_31076 [Baudoinia panamericana UAMH 10762]|uniref:Uncharacterized protein n=1 Tax=Baudoinia panamericana (strain UAMH 10762) TaxID=717646 RepID=M2NHI4_BAUPA|nr:uncharacterized protein BAUCODRAFT_31076 [Baudoinia panamericana UAMH 10762]EMC98809.1 hypothetical protein BAUCODRAFT_31076 [Baudoinia panamericana UAMH 10762]